MDGAVRMNRPYLIAPFLIVYFSWKVALPTTWLSIWMSTRYVPTPSAPELRLYMYWQSSILKFEPVSAEPL